MAIRKRSGAPPTTRPNAASNASRCTGNSAAARPPDRSEQLVQSGERQMGLGLDAGRREHRHAPLPRDSPGIGQQPGLSDTGLAAEHQRPAVRTDFVQRR
jgi:hypothetical protein